MQKMSPSLRGLPRSVAESAGKVCQRSANLQICCTSPPSPHTSQWLPFLLESASASPGARRVAAFRRCSGDQTLWTSNKPNQVTLLHHPTFKSVCKLTKRHHTRARDNSFIRAVCWCQGLIFPCQMTNAGWASWATQLTILKN